ncbi:MAG: hypothetical protein N2C14_07530 [Planctomycetales bacterium]
MYLTASLLSIGFIVQAVLALAGWEKPEKRTAKPVAIVMLITGVVGALFTVIGLPFLIGF